MSAFEELSTILSEEKLAVVCQLFGGTTIYIPPQPMSKHERNRHIVADYQVGMSYKSLAVKYKLCQNTIRRITKEAI